MSTYTMTSAAALLKEPFDATLREFINQSDDTWSMFVSSAQQMPLNTRGRKFAISIARAFGYGSPAEAGLLPTPVMQGDLNAISYYKNHFIQGEVSGDVLDAPNDLALKAFAKRPMQTVAQTFKEYQNFFLFGNGNGALTVVTTYAGGGATTFTAAPGNGNASYGNRYVFVGMRISFYSSAGVARVNGGSDVYVATVTAKNSSTGTVTCSGGLPSDLVATDLVVFADSAYGQEMEGLDFHVDNSSGTWLTINKGTYPVCNAVEYDFSGAIAANKIDNALLLAQNNQGGGDPTNDYVLISHGVQKKNYRALGYSLTRTTPVSGGDTKLDLGFPEASHNGMRWKSERACPPEVMYGLRWRTFAIEATVMPQSYKYGRESIFAQKPGSGNYYDAFLFATYWRGNVVCLMPNQNWKGYGITYTTAEVATFQ